MSQEHDARVTGCIVTKKGEIFAIDTLSPNQDFDVLMDIRLGPAANAIVNRIQAWATINNRTQFKNAAPTKSYNNASPGPQAQPRAEQIRVAFNATDLQGVNDGDLLEAVVTLKVTTGAYTDSSSMTFSFLYTV